MGGRANSPSTRLSIRWKDPVARVGRIDRSHLGSTSFGVVGPKCASRLSTCVRLVKQTCKHHNIDPFVYLQGFFRRLPSQPADQLAELLTEAWFASHPPARRRNAY
jgi:hypothetical protein